jgi:hypothetical protein
MEQPITSRLTNLLMYSAFHTVFNIRHMKEVSSDLSSCKVCFQSCSIFFQGCSAAIRKEYQIIFFLLVALIHNHTFPSTIPPGQATPLAGSIVPDNIKIQKETLKF